MKITGEGYSTIIALSLSFGLSVQVRLVEICITSGKNVRCVPSTVLIFSLRQPLLFSYVDLAVVNKKK